MMSFEDHMAEGTLQPLYVDVEPDSDTMRAIHRVQTRYNVPTPHPTKKMHTTLIFSSKPCKWPKLLPNKVMRAEFDRFEIFTQRNGKKCLVMKLRSPELKARHDALMAEMDASYDFDQYLPHITISYNVEDFDIAQLSGEMFPEIFFSGERCTALNLDYGA